ncbi:cupredoxin domain-containing protein [Haladaptatus sp. DFWS20]|uniref:cupredoxin domain-containing protein n=1 Tax=Haladaptatus sp. DFWS20 TaxID=3403467 RepID=UPI003EB94133
MAPKYRGRTRRPTRRRFLGQIAAGVVIGGSGVVTAQQDGETIDPSETIRLRAQVPGWRGQAPESIGGLRNPRLTLQDSEIYTVEWTNVDGQPHTFSIQNSQQESVKAIQQLQSPVPTTTEGGQGNGGNQQTTTTEQGTIPQDETVEVTDILSERGATQRLRFEATGEMAVYLCTIHPESMVGSLRTRS